MQNMSSIQNQGMDAMFRIGQMLPSFMNWGAYKTTISSNGRISIPEAERNALGLGDGDLVQVIILPIAKKSKNKDDEKLNNGENSTQRFQRDVFSTCQKNIDRIFTGVKKSVPQYHQSITNMQQEYLQTFENLVNSTLTLQSEYVKKTGVATSVPEDNSKNDVWLY